MPMPIMTPMVTPVVAAGVDEAAVAAAADDIDIAP
jgi:hypothetical protein